MDEILQISVPSSANVQLPDPTLKNFYEDLENRVYWMNDEISEYTLDLAQYILRWNREDRDKPVEERKPIRLIICSPGGSLEVAETLNSFIKMSKTPIHGIGIGMVASAASLIYLSCHKKYALDSAYFILHKGSCSGLNGNFNELEAFMSDYKQQIAKMVQFYIENTKYTEEEVNKNINSDWYVRFPEALDKGIVDEMVTDIDSLI